MFFKSYFASGDILYTAVLVWRFFTYYIIVLLGALVVVIDQLVFGCRRKQEDGALCEGKKIRLASAQLVGAALFLCSFMTYSHAPENIDIFLPCVYSGLGG